MDTPRDGEISERKVLHNASGYYVGTEQYENGQWWPHTRDSYESWDRLGLAVMALATGDWSYTSKYRD